MSVLQLVKAFRNDSKHRWASKQLKKITNICSCEQDVTCTKHTLYLDVKRYSRATIQSLDK